MSSFSLTRSIISILIIYISPSLLNFSLGICLNAITYSLISIFITVNSLDNNKNILESNKKYSSIKLIIQSPLNFFGLG